MLNDVRKFQEKFTPSALPTVPTYIDNMEDRINHLQEELDELFDALTIEEMADALIDIVYIALGTALQMGLPWNKLWDDVQRANMSKVHGNSLRHMHDALKPPGWVGPKTLQILHAAGFRDERDEDVC